MQKLDRILNLLFSNKTEFIIGRDININYLDNSNKRQQLDTLLATYNLTSTVHFPTRISNVLITARDNSFINKSRNYTISLFINGLSDHDGQLIILNNIII
jgi:hypothetical protein